MPISDCVWVLHLHDQWVLCSELALKWHRRDFQWSLYLVNDRQRLFKIKEVGCMAIVGLLNHNAVGTSKNEDEACQLPAKQASKMDPSGIGMRW